MKTQLRYGYTLTFVLGKHFWSIWDLEKAYATAGLQAKVRPDDVAFDSIVFTLSPQGTILNKSRYRGVAPILG